MSDDRDRSPQFSFGIEPDASAPQAGYRTTRRWVLSAVFVLVLLGSLGSYLYVFEPQLVQSALSHLPFGFSSKTTHAFKWQDKRGAWHITDEPPPEGTSYEKLTVRSDTNVVPATRALEK